jgi:glycosyl transferase family (putative galactosyltransferase)
VAKAICTVAFGPHAELLEIGRPTLEEYAQRHGYDVIVRDQPETTLTPSWERIPLIQGLLGRYDEVLYVDADAIFVDVSRDIFEALVPDRAFGFVMHVNEGNMLPNAGVLAVRAHRPALDLLDAIWGSRDSYKEHPWQEQMALCELLGFAALPTKVMRLERPSMHLLTTQFLGVEWNSVGLDQAAAPRIKHYPSVGHDERVSAMSRDRDLVRRASAPSTHRTTVVLDLHDADVQALAAVFERLTPNRGSLQILILAPQAGPLDPLLKRVEDLVTVVRSDQPPDARLLGALPAIDGEVVIVTSQPLSVTTEIVEHLHAAISEHNELAVAAISGDHQFVAFDRRRLPPSGWIADIHTARRSLLEPVFAGLAAGGCQIVSR